jgi:hypothetical protein
LLFESRLGRERGLAVPKSVARVALRPSAQSGQWPNAPGRCGENEVSANRVLLLKRAENTQTKRGRGWENMGGLVAASSKGLH